jgi:hypothetical protein
MRSEPRIALAPLENAVHVITFDRSQKDDIERSLLAKSNRGVNCIVIECHVAFMGYLEVKKQMIIEAKLTVEVGTRAPVPIVCTLYLP